MVGLFIKLFTTLVVAVPLILTPPKLTDMESFGSYSEDELLQFIGSTEKGSEHPLGEAIVKGAEEKGSVFLPIEDFEALSGCGDTARIDGKKVAVGNVRLMQKVLGEARYQYKDRKEGLEALAKTVMLIAIDGKIEGVVAVADTIKAESKRAVKALQDMGIEVIMLTLKHLALRLESVEKSLLMRIYARQTHEFILPAMLR
jgi:Cu+-exporting ATPase